MPPDSSFTYDNPFFLQILNGISQCCTDHQYLSIIISGQSDQETLECIRQFHQVHGISTFIVLFSRQDDPVADFLIEEGIQYILIGHPCRNPGQTVTVDNDNIAAGQDAAAYLHSLGHQRIGFLGPASRAWFSACRRNGLKLFAQEHDLECRPEWIIEVPSGNPEALKPLADLLRSPERPTALITSDEMYALTLRQVCAETGIRIPDDLSVLTFNNSIISRLTSPQLTSVDINALQLGIEAALQAIKYNENPDLMASRTLVPYQLVIRASTIRPRKQPAER